MKLWRKVRDGTRRVADTVVPRPGGDVGGAPARGVVVEVINAPWGEDASSALWSSVTLSLRRADAPADTPTEVQIYLKSRGWRAIEAGQDVPIRVDEQTGSVLGLDGDAYEAEVDAGKHAAPDLAPDMQPDAASIEAIEGVSLDLWATTMAGIAKSMIPPAEQDAFAASKGIPAGRWTAISAAWQQRANTDWKVGAELGAAFQSAMGKS
jgi:hypothetical protein